MFSSVLRTSFTALRAPARAPALALASPSAAFARRYITQEARSKIQKAVTSMPVVLFMKGNPEAPQCGFSRAAVQVLDIHGVPPEKMQTFDVLEDSELRQSIKEFSDWPTIPQLYVNGEFVGGCDILLNMHQSGELADLFVKAGIVPPEEPQETQSQSQN
ncbi:Monothiol glutaredoxin-5, mitochondrial [Trametes pubescens]|uniref:Monothiol glutaredoxin-5, mitochondrial n=1 Tax=Trametes pubescens TaxID=154538 RepID=A0A1M2V6X5_TRAPU|nr:Monothiol glutaredoxin-5, mitochondrial [Trametes pubescens]